MDGPTARRPTQDGSRAKNARSPARKRALRSLHRRVRMCCPCIACACGCARFLSLARQPSSPRRLAGAGHGRAAAAALCQEKNYNTRGPHSCQRRVMAWFVRVFAVALSNAGSRQAARPPHLIRTKSRCVRAEPNTEPRDASEGGLLAKNTVCLAARPHTQPLCGSARLRPPSPHFGVRLARIASRRHVRRRPGSAVPARVTLSRLTDKGRAILCQRRRDD